VGLASPNWNITSQWSFCQFLECQVPPHKRKASPQKRKPPFWNFLATVPLRNTSRFQSPPKAITSCIWLEFVYFWNDVVYEKIGRQQYMQSICNGLYRTSGVASPKHWVEQKNCGGAKMFDLRWITLFCLEKRLSKHKITIFSKNLGGMAPLATPMYRTARNCLWCYYLQLIWAFACNLVKKKLHSNNKYMEQVDNMLKRLVKNACTNNNGKQKKDWNTFERQLIKLNAINIVLLCCVLKQ